MNPDDKSVMATPSETRSSPRLSFSQQMSAIGTRLTRALSRDGSGEAETLVNKPGEFSLAIYKRRDKL